MLRPPRALLLDFGGVLVDAPTQPSAPPELVQRLSEVVDGAVSSEQVVRDLSEGVRAYALWRDEVGKAAEPVELSHAQVWAAFVTPSWPQEARDAVEREATPLGHEKPSTTLNLYTHRSDGRDQRIREAFADDPLTSNDD